MEKWELTQQEIEKARQEYLSIVNTQPYTEVRRASQRVKQLRKRLARELSEGAIPCPDCGKLPIGMIQACMSDRQPDIRFEVGCAFCRDHSRRSHRAKGRTRELAVSNWNGGPSRWLPPRRAIVKHSSKG